MTERGLPIVDGAPACPFVAFEDDRDGRGLAPDHRHRCYAEPRPAPRALAHQEAYCLSSAFPVCPTFQDWARREAAAARSNAGGEPPTEPEPPVSRPLPPHELEPRHATGTETPMPLPPRRNPHRDWAAPPPWSGDDEADGGEEPAPFATPHEPARDAGAGAWSDPSVGLAESAAYRLAGPDPDEPVPARAAAGDVRAFEPRDEVVDRYRPTERPELRPDRVPASRPPGPQSRATAPQPQRREPQDPGELFGPAWERPRRYEAYPSLRTRIGLPGFGGISRLGIAAAAIVLAAVVLFFVGPMLLGIGTDNGGGGAPTALPSAEASVTPEPTVAPPPTPQIYVVARGDTMSKIAKRFGLTVDQLLAANKQIKNPNKIQIGDEITIPVPVPDQGSGAIEGASPSP